VLDTLQAWMSDETSQGLTLQVLYNLIRETDITSKPIQQHSSTDPDTVTDVETPEEVGGDRTIPRAQDALYRLEIESHRIEQATRNLQNNPSQHHVTQGLGRKILQTLTPRGFSLDIRTTEVQELRSCTVFGKRCECIAQKCTHLERLPPLASHLLLLSHCVLTRHGGKKIKLYSFPPGVEPSTSYTSN